MKKSPSPPNSRTLLIIRHAHRNKTWGSEADNGLSARGRAQAERITRYFYRRFGKKDARAAWIVSSPKVRCRETLQGIARAAGVVIEDCEALNEGGNVKAKAREFLRLWGRRRERLVIAGVHGDWVPLFARAATGAALELDKGGWLEITREGRKAPRVRYVIQEFKTFKALKALRR